MKHTKTTLALLASLLLALPTISASTESESVTAILNRELIIRVDGDDLMMFDSNGESVYPLTYDGTTYLPIRVLCDQLDLGIHWNGEDYAVEIDTPDVPAYDTEPIERKEFELSVNENGLIVLTAYNGAGGDVRIPDGVAVIGAHAFDQVLLSARGAGVPTSVYIPDSVRIIEDMAFFASVDSKGEGLKVVRMSTGIESIGRNAFASCALLEAVYFETLPMREITIDGASFADCPALVRNDLDAAVIPEDDLPEVDDTESDLPEAVESGT